MKALIAFTVLVAAAIPAWAASGSDAPIETLSRNQCQPVIGTVTRVYTDPRRPGTAIDLDQLLLAPESGGKRWTTHDGIFTVFIPAENMKPFPALDSYAGQQVAVWIATGWYNKAGIPFIANPRQLQPLSSALADPKKTWCFLPALDKLYY